MGLSWAAHMGLAVWDPNGAQIASQYGQARIHPTLGPYGIAIWAPRGSIKGSSYGLVHMGPIWACLYAKARIHPTLGPYGLAIWVLYGRAHKCLTVWNPYGTSMGVPIWATRTHTVLCPFTRLTIWAHMGPLRACSYVYHMGPLLMCIYALVRIGPIWVLYVCVHKGLAV